MKWQHLRRSTNIESRSGSKAFLGGGGSLFALALLVYLAGGDPTRLLMEGASRTLQSSMGQRLDPKLEAEQTDFVSAVLGSTEDVWDRAFSEQGNQYNPPKLILFSNMVDSACGRAGAAVGPFYCPLDQAVYLDLNFFYDLEHNLGAPGDFARAYVVAHEVGHHIQTLMGLTDEVRNRRMRMSESQANELSVRQELQADCLAGVWAYRTDAEYGVLEQGDMEEALNAAAQIGDDRLQQRQSGQVVPDSFTHGTSEQRLRWFRRGAESGDIDACDTFSGVI